MRYLLLSLLLGCSIANAAHVECFSGSSFSYDGKVQISGNIYRVDDDKGQVHFVPVSNCIVDGELTLITS